MSTFTKDFQVPAENVAGLKERVKEANKRAAKLGVEPIVLTVGDGVTVSHGKANGLEVTSIWHPATISGRTPHYDGWGFTASLELTEEGSIIRTLPGLECPPEHFERGNVCDHCGKARNRKNTYVIVHEDGRSMNVGRSCLKDFLGTGRYDPMLIAGWFSYIWEELEGDGEFFGSGGGSGAKNWNIDTVLELTGAVISCRGWVSGGMVNEGKHPGPSTADICRTFLSHNKDRASRGEKELVAEIREALDATLESRKVDAAAAIAWITGDGVDATRDYIFSIRVLANRGWVELKDFGFACSILPSWRNAKARQEEDDRRANENRDAAAQSGHVGEVGKREEFSLRVNRIIEIPSQYYGEEARRLHLMEDADGNRFKWWATSLGLEESADFVTVKATVKSHGEYNGIKETVVNRVAQVAQVPPAMAA